MPLALPHHRAPTRHASPLGAALGAAVLALATTADGQGSAPPVAPAHGAVPEGSTRPPGNVPAPLGPGSSAAPASTAPPLVPLAPAPASPPPPPPPPVAPPIGTPGYPPQPTWQDAAASTAWSPPHPVRPMNDEVMFYVSAALMAASCAMMTPAMLRLDLTLDDFISQVGRIPIYIAGAGGMIAYLVAAPLAIAGAIPALEPAEEHRSDAALATGIVLTMAGAAAAPLGVFFASSAARSDFEPGLGVGLLVAAGVGHAIGVPLIVWGAAPTDAEPPPAPYLGFRF